MVKKLTVKKARDLWLKTLDAYNQLLKVENELKTIDESDPEIRIVKDALEAATMGKGYAAKAYLLLKPIAEKEE
jgi:hypothetical protein